MREEVSQRNLSKGINFIESGKNPIDLVIRSKSMVSYVAHRDKFVYEKLRRGPTFHLPPESTSVVNMAQVAYVLRKGLNVKGHFDQL